MISPHSLLDLLWSITRIICPSSIALELEAWHHLLLTWGECYIRIHICSMQTLHCCRTRLNAWCSSILPLHLLPHWDNFLILCVLIPVLCWWHIIHPLLSSCSCSCLCMKHGMSGTMAAHLKVNPSKTMNCHRNFYIFIETSTSTSIYQGVTISL